MNTAEIVKPKNRARDEDNEKVYFSERANQVAPIAFPSR